MWWWCTLGPKIINRPNLFQHRVYHLTTLPLLLSTQHLPLSTGSTLTVHPSQVRWLKWKSGRRDPSTCNNRQDQATGSSGHAGSSERKLLLLRSYCGGSHVCTLLPISLSPFLPVFQTHHVSCTWRHAATPCGNQLPLPCDPPSMCSSRPAANTGKNTWLVVAGTGSRHHHLSNHSSIRR